MNFKAFAAPLIVAIAALTTACGPRVGLQTPSGFAVLEKQEEYVYRATTADGVVLAVRAELNQPRGNLDFWSDVVDRQLRGQGYLAEGAPVEVRTAFGLPGRQIRYLRDENGRSSRFWAVVFVTGSRVWVIEAGGETDRFDRKMQDGIQKAIE